MMAVAKPIQEVSTFDLYESWSDTYDTDGNVLQQLDDELIKELLPSFFPPSSTDALSSPSASLTVLDLGCGTGRNTQKLVQALPTGSTLVALDASPSMMERAEAKISALPDVKNGRIQVQWIVGDVRKLPDDLKVDVVISTLVLEHIPLKVYFEGVAKVLKKGNSVEGGSWAYVSDMHPEMGTSRAAYLGQDGVKRLGTSWQHSIEETIGAAKEEGLALRANKTFERGIENEERATLFGERAKKWIGKRLLSAFIFDLVA